MTVTTSCWSKSRLVLWKLNSQLSTWDKMYVIISRTLSFCCLFKQTQPRLQADQRAGVFFFLKEKNRRARAAFVKFQQKLADDFLGHPLHLTIQNSQNYCFIALPLSPSLCSGESDPRGPHHFFFIEQDVRTQIDWLIRLIYHRKQINEIWGTQYVTIKTLVSLLLKFRYLANLLYQILRRNTTILVCGLFMSEQIENVQQ